MPHTAWNAISYTCGISHYTSLKVMNVLYDLDRDPHEMDTLEDKTLDRKQYAARSVRRRHPRDFRSCSEES